MNRVFRSKKNRWLTGLCGGVAEFLGVNPIVVRIVAVLLEFSVLGLIAYFLISYCIPESSDAENNEDAEEKLVEPEAVKN